jgi:Domain of unknown function (DUF6468)
MTEFFTVPVILDLVLILLLAATISYCVNLSRKLSVMRNAQGDLKKVAQEFDQAIVRSKIGVDELKRASEQTGKDLHNELDEARELLEELKLINASSSRIADRLQQGVDGTGKKLSGSQSSRMPSDEDEFEIKDLSELSPRTEAERELLQALTKSK